MRAKCSFVSSLDFLLAGLGALRRCDSLMWRATPHSSRLASHPIPTAKSPSYFLSSTEGSFVKNLDFLLAGLGALRRCDSLMWRATPHSSRLASHPNPTAKSPSYFLSSPKINASAKARRVTEIGHVINQFVAKNDRTLSAVPISVWHTTILCNQAHHHRTFGKLELPQQRLQLIQ